MHSHRIIILLCCLLAAAVSLSAQDKSDAAAIRALELKWTESYKQHNIDILSSLLAEDFVITIEDGSIYSKAGYISHSADPSTKVQVAELSDLKVRMHGDTAVVTGLRRIDLDLRPRRCLSTEPCRRCRLHHRALPNRTTEK